MQLRGFETQTDAYGNEVQHPVYEETYLAGVLFEVHATETIIGKDGTLWYEQDELVDTIATTASDADASKLLPLGKYYLIETAAPDGYVFDDTHYEADLVYADDQTPVVETKITLVNEYLPVEITLQKEKEILVTTNHNDGTVTQAIANAPGQGFIFGLYNDKDIHYSGGTLMADTLVATGATDADGNLTFAGHYPHGDYYIKELSAPDGWKLNPNVFPITLDPSAQNDSVIRIALPEPVHDEMELDTLGDQITALFIIISDTDDTFNFLVSMCYTQLFNLLCDKADDVYGGRLPVHVRCLIDECANIGQIPKLEKLMATIRSREISACLVLQAQSQLKALYKDNADTITGNCDSMIFLGGKEKGTLKEIEEMLGKETIDSFNTGESRGREVSRSLNYTKLGKALMSMDELSVMNGSKCVLQLRGVRPFLSDKYDITRHPNYQYLSDADPRNTFDIEEFLSTKLKVNLSEPYEVFEIGD